MRCVPLHHCNSCDQDLPATDFSLNAASSSGLQNRCKKCMREYRKGHYQVHAPELRDKAKRQRENNGERPPALLRLVLTKTPCIECSSLRRARHFKLREGPRSFNLKQARQIGVTETRLVEELKKYDVVCEICSPPHTEYTGAYHKLSTAQIEELNQAPAPGRGALKRLVLGYAQRKGEARNPVPE